MMEIIIKEYSIVYTFHYCARLEIICVLDMVQNFAKISVCSDSVMLTQLLLEGLLEVLHGRNLVIKGCDEIFMIPVTTIGRPLLRNLESILTIIKPRQMNYNGSRAVEKLIEVIPFHKRFPKCRYE